MGQETKRLSYTTEQEQEFYLFLKEETQLLKQWIKNQHFKNSPQICGYEAEGWIINEKALPAPCSDKLLENISDPHITPELSKFNFEINGNPFHLNKSLADNLEKDFQFFINKCSNAAIQQNNRVMFIGIYPDLTQVPFGMKQIYPRNRYYAINNRINSLRKKSINIQIQGRETFLIDTSNIIHEAQTTSLQIHLQVNFSQAKDFYNASLIASPIMSALCANSPYVFGKELWEESRIPLFDRVISLDVKQGERDISRVGLGHDFVHECISELFEHNLLHPILLPEIKKEGKNKLQHLLLHNGTIWRWNRPIIGFDEKGQPHFRIEHRVPSSGPTSVDMQANILFFIGLVHFIQKHIAGKKLQISFQELENDFYLACRLGFSTKIEWLNEKIYKIHELLSQKLIPSVWEELNQLDLQSPRVNYLINDVIKNRVTSLQNGSTWQKAYVRKFGKDFDKLIQDYWDKQNKNIPIHEWSV